MVPRGDASRQTMMFVQNRGHRLSTHLCPKPHSEKGDDPTRRIGKQGPGLSAGWLKLQGRTVALAGLKTPTAQRCRPPGHFCVEVLVVKVRLRTSPRRAYQRTVPRPCDCNATGGTEILAVRLNFTCQ